MKPIPGARRSSRTALTRVACGLALVALLLMGCSILWPKPLLVILAMSVGHLLGGVALVCYLLVILLDVTRSPRDPPSSPDAAKTPLR